MRLSEIRRSLDLRGEANFRDLEIVHLTADSRKVRPGSLFFAVPGTRLCGTSFFAVPGTRLCGTSFVDQAVRQGATAIAAPVEVPLPPHVPGLWVREARTALSRASSVLWGSPSRSLRIVGVTGTNGKTTTTYVLRSIFEAAGYRTGLIGTTGHFLGERVADADVTTPDPVRIQSMLAEMRTDGITHVAMEVSSHALDQARVRDVQFTVGVFTNLTGDHLDYHRDMAAYREAKATLFRQLRREAVAVLNGDDDASLYFRNVTPARTLAYGNPPAGHVEVRTTKMDLSGSEGMLATPWGSIPFRSNLVGPFNLSNIMAAATAAGAIGIPREAVAEGIEMLHGVPGRLEAIDGGQEFAVMVDYAHTEDALRSVLRTVRPLVPGRVILVFGCGGDRDRTKRPRMGAVAETLADVAVVTSDNPRGEDPDRIIGEILEGMRRPRAARVLADRREAIHEAIGSGREGDLVLIAGKGHETTQSVGGQVLPFDDREVARECIGTLGRIFRAPRTIRMGAGGGFYARA
jgi:UDP-N-acetylmuramoyl-L-alanyl-D-glutamate--2,6-diaminopimelate ligase